MYGNQKTKNGRSQMSNVRWEMVQVNWRLFMGMYHSALWRVSISYRFGMLRRTWWDKFLWIVHVWDTIGGTRYCYCLKCLYSVIQELSSCGWSKKEKHSSAPNAVAFTRRFNQVGLAEALWVIWAQWFGWKQRNNQLDVNFKYLIKWWTLHVESGMSGACRWQLCWV